MLASNEDGELEEMQETVEVPEKKAEESPKLTEAAVTGAGVKPKPVVLAMAIAVGGCNGSTEKAMGMMGLAVVLLQTVFPGCFAVLETRVMEQE